MNNVMQQILSQVCSSSNDISDEEIKKFIAEKMSIGGEAIVKIQEFLKTNHEKIEKWVKYFKHTSIVTNELTLFERIDWDPKKRDFKFRSFPCYVDFLYNKPEEYYKLRQSFCSNRKDTGDTAILRQLCFVFAKISYNEKRHFHANACGRIEFKKIGLNHYKMLLHTTHNELFNSDDIIEIYDTGKMTRMHISQWYGIGNTCMDLPSEAKYRYDIAKTPCVALWLGMFVILLPQIQTLLDRVAKMYDKEFAAEDAGIINKIKYVFKYDDDSVGYDFTH